MVTQWTKQQILENYMKTVLVENIKKEKIAKLHKSILIYFKSQNVTVVAAPARDSKMVQWKRSYASLVVFVLYNELKNELYKHLCIGLKSLAH